MFDLFGIVREKELRMRYFIISYFHGDGHLGSGIKGIESRTYPNIYNLKKDATVKNLTPISIVEVSKKDYDDFWWKEES